LLGAISSISVSSADDGTAATPAAAGTSPAAGAAASIPTPSSAGRSTSSSSSKKQQQLGSRLLPAKLAGGIDILKVDVEGREPDVFATAGRLLDSGKVDNIIMEYSPGYYYQVTERL
jgi:hypothetical protein